VAADYRHVTDPGYDRDRGQVSIVGFRVHFEDAVPFDKFSVGNRSGSRGRCRQSQPLRTSRAALGMVSLSARTTFRIRAKLALSYSVAS